MQVSLKKSVTLVELIISIVLLGVIVLGATAFHLSSERFLSSSEKKTQVLNELTFILQHLHKNILVAVGDVDNRGIIVTGNTLQLIQATRTVEYNFNTGNKTISFRVVSGAWETLTSSFVNLGFAVSLNAADGGVAITNLALRLDPALPEDTSSNPQVTTIDAGAGRRTVYFYSLAHSWR